MEKLEYINKAFNALRINGIVRTQKDFANLCGVSEAQMSKAMKGDERNLTDNLIGKVQLAMEGKPQGVPEDWIKEFPSLDKKREEPVAQPMIPIIPTDAIAGTLMEFATSVTSYDCERMVSPIKGADYAIKVCGESMTPEYPNGSTIIIKKVSDEFIEWGRCFCLDTCNGAVVKLVFPTDDPQVVECRSINPDYPPFKVKTSLIYGWYRVLMCLSLK